MSNEPKPIPPRLIDLMVEDATQGLSPQDKAELSAAITQDETIRIEAEAYAMAATAIELSLNQPQQTEALPGALRKKLIATATGHVQVDTSAPAFKLSSSTTDTPAPPATTPFSFTDGRMFGWYAAIAALVALAFVLTFEPTNQPTTGPGSMPTIAERFDQLATDRGTITATWGFNADGGDPAYANTTGQVIWNADKQTGYMKLAGLPVNDPNEFQYHLWIVDASRDPETENTNRIDGGVFDITTQGEVTVPINAKLLARDAAAFAITVEAPGGVVESKGPLQALAVVEQKS